MHAYFSDDVEQMRRETARLVDDLMQHEQEFQATNVVPAAVDQSFKDLGYYGLRVPEAFGGSGLSMLPTVAIVSELRVALGPASSTLVHHGNQRQQDTWLPRVAQGDCGVAFALTEPEAGSDLSSMRTKAVRTHGGYLLNGSKTFISNADKAGLFVVFARTNADAKLREGISAFLVPAGHQGMKVGPPMPNMGTTVNGLFEVFFDDCMLPDDALLGEEGKGFSYAMESLNEGRINVGAIAVSMGRYAVDLAIAHTNTRISFGAPLSENQAIRHMLANAAMELHAGWLMVLDAATRLDTRAEAGVQSAMVKVYCSEVAGRAIDTAVQLFGASGYTRGFAVERLYRDVRVLRIYEGASEILRNLVGRKLLDSGCTGI